ncbi:MAG: hypothetical protein IIA87_05720 [Nanoarchaeota archaeon]|nr:hypothetical protein [Nanoarchaeota archaeon]
MSIILDNPVVRSALDVRVEGGQGYSGRRFLNHDIAYGNMNLAELLLKENNLTRAEKFMSKARPYADAKASDLRTITGDFLADTSSFAESKRRVVEKYNSLVDRFNEKGVPLAKLVDEYRGRIDMSMERFMWIVREHNQGYAEGAD